MLGFDDDGNPSYRTPESTLRGSADLNAKGDLLAVQARFPIVGFDEMRGFGEFYKLEAPIIRDAIAKRLQEEEGWLRPFQIAFGEPDGTAQELITFENIAAAISAYQDSQVFIDSPFKQYAQGDAGALTQQQKEGALLFFRSFREGGFGCAGCHSGDFFTDEQTHVAGFPQLGRGKRIDGEDPGAYLVSQARKDRYAFRTPSLLNVAQTGPWGHSGAFSSLEELIRYHINPKRGVEAYDFTFKHLPQIAEATAPYPEAESLTRKAVAKVGRNLRGKAPTDTEVAQLTAFLEALTDPCVSSRECLQPWMASHEDDHDGFQLQPLFGPDRATPFMVGQSATTERTPAPEAGPALPEAEVSRLVNMLTACANHSPAHDEPSRLQFVDVTADAGLDHAHFIPGRMWYGADYSYVVEYALESAPVLAGDLDLDCYPDLVFATHNGDEPEVIRYMNRAGSFEKDLMTLAGLPDAVGALGLADLNGDYQPDLAIGNMFGARESTLYHGSDEGDYELVQKMSMSKQVVGFSFGDFDNDNWIDAFAAHWDVNPRPAFSPALLRNHQGYLMPADEEAGTTGAQLEQNFHFSPGFADFDLDGDADLVIASDFGTSEVLRNEGGRYTVITDREVITDENGMGHAIADFNNDGMLDWFVSAIHNDEYVENFDLGESGNRLYLGTGTGPMFEDVTPESGVEDSAWAWGACAADFDNDGWVDIFSENGFGFIPAYVHEHVPDYIYKLLPLKFEEFHREYPRLFMNQGGAVFEEVGRQWGLTEKTNGRGVLCMDHDRDGDVDLLVSQNAEKPILYENRAGGVGGNSFVGFHVIGTSPNTSAVGTRIEISIGGNKQYRHVLLNTNYQSQNPTTVHFGVGKAIRIDSMKVTWPGGATEIFEGIDTGSYYPLLHPDVRDAGNELEVADVSN